MIIKSQILTDIPKITTWLYSPNLPGKGIHVYNPSCLDPDSSCGHPSCCSQLWCLETYFWIFYFFYFVFSHLRIYVGSKEESWRWLRQPWHWTSWSWRWYSPTSWIESWWRLLRQPCPHWWWVPPHSTGIPSVVEWTKHRGYSAVGVCLVSLAPAYSGLLVSATPMLLRKKSFSFWWRMVKFSTPCRARWARWAVDNSLLLG